MVIFGIYWCDSRPELALVRDQRAGSLLSTDVLDFLHISEQEARNGDIKLVPGFLVKHTEDLMTRGGRFYAVWDEERGVWSQDLNRLVQLVDDSVRDYLETMDPARRYRTTPSYMVNHSSQVYSRFLKYCSELQDNYRLMDQHILFADEEGARETYSTRKLPYKRVDDEPVSYKQLMTPLYHEEELQKLEWCIGAIFTGASKELQKFLVVYGAPGTGKSTYTKLLEKLFEGYTAVFKGRDLGNPNKSFALASFRNGPLVGIEHDSVLDRIQDNTSLNSIVSHDVMEVNEKNKAQYELRLSTFLVMGTNGLVNITSSDSGIIRRLIDVKSAGFKHPPSVYRKLWRAVDFELGAIANHCIKVFEALGPDYYEDYRPLRMIQGTNVLYNYVDAYSDEFESREYVTLNEAYVWYRSYCEASGVRYPLAKNEFCTELQTYFSEFRRRTREFANTRLSNVFVGFKPEALDFEQKKVEESPTVSYLDTWVEGNSPLDSFMATTSAQYANENGTPAKVWDDVTTTLADLDTSLLHFVIPSESRHIVIDFDLTDANGEKSREVNLEAASVWPPTYAEFSKSGQGLHLHYIYDGDPETLSRLFAPGIEIKVFRGKASLRRKLSQHNGHEIATLAGGLPIKEKAVIDKRVLSSERALRSLLVRNLRKEIHPGTKPSMDFIHKILNDAYDSGLVYNVEDMKGAIANFAANSTHQAAYCMALVKHLKLRSEQETPDVPVENSVPHIYDVEVFPNLFVVSYGPENSDEIYSLVNPSAEDVSKLLDLKLIGFYNRDYDNHILYAASLGYSPKQLFELSKAIVGGDRNKKFAAAYKLSYADIYDYCSKKQSLKKWQIELGLNHQELGLPWNEPVEEALWPLVVEYCENDVRTTRQLRENRQGDWAARQILAALSGLSVNDTNNKHSAKIIFGDDKNPQSEFIYTDLSKEFPGYKYEYGKSTYRGVETGEGGYVYAEPGMYENVTCFDVASMHPTSLIELQLFGPKYTKRFEELKLARVYIKHGEIDKAGELLDGKLKPFLSGDLKALSDALKIVINSVYGMTKAAFDNPFRDPRNVDNIVAKRGALFMVELQKQLEERGLNVIHIKTDSIKLADVDDATTEFIFEFGRKYGYEFEVEDVYDKFCLVNNAVYIAKGDGKWKPTGAQFAHPVVYKTLFSKESLSLDDFVEVKSVSTAMYLESDAGRQFVGKVGAFVPVKTGGARLVRESPDGSFAAVTGTKGYLWKEAIVETDINNIDLSYSNKLIAAAEENIAKYGDVDIFTERV